MTQFKFVCLSLSIFFVVFMLVFCFLFLPIVNAEPIGGTAASFLKIGEGARAVGMGEAFTGLADDATALYWNPAGLVTLKQSQMTLEHSMWFQDINIEYGVLAIPSIANIGAIGASVLFLSTSSISQTTVDITQQPETSPGSGVANQAYFIDNTGQTFSASDMLITLGYALRVFPGWQGGLSVKVINESLADKSALAFGSDLGVLCTNTGVRNLSVGMAVQNIGTSLKLDQNGFSLPLQFRLGSAMKVPDKNVVFVADFIQPNDNTGQLNFGLEYSSYYKSINIIGRLGYKYQFGQNDFETNNGITAGLGSAFMNFEFDYGFEPLGELGNTHRFDLTFKW